MNTIKITKNGYTFRWRGGSFIGVWEDVNAGRHVPDDMIQVPASINRSRAGTNDIRHIINVHMGWTE